MASVATKAQTMNIRRDRRRRWTRVQEWAENKARKECDIVSSSAEGQRQPSVSAMEPEPDESTSSIVRRKRDSDTAGYTPTPDETNPTAQAPATG